MPAYKQVKPNSSRSIKEMQKRISSLEKLENSAKSFKQQFKKQTITAITAAFAFLIALVWRDYISKIVETITKTNQASLFSAIIVTVISVLGIMVVSKWASK